MIVIARGDEEENPRIGAKYQSNLQTYTTFKVISAQPPNSKAGMKMRRAEAIASGIDCLGNFASACLREPANSGTKSLGKVNLQRQLPNCPCTV